MKKWSRILGLALMLTLTSFVAADAFPSYGSCVAYCDGQPYELSYQTYGQCCFTAQWFTQGCYTVGFSFYPYEGDSLICGG